MRRVRVILGWLLLGVIVNIAFSWSIACWWYAYGSEETLLFFGTKKKSWIVLRDHGFGTSRIVIDTIERWGYRYEGYPYKSPPFEKEKTLPEVIPRWSQCSRAAAKDGKIPDTPLIECAYGWPLRSFTFTLIGGRMYGWELPRRSHVAESNSLSVERRVLPCRPVWNGLIANSLLFTTSLWLLIPGPLALRRHLRRRRGLCPKCAYDLKGADHAACPECGQAC